MLTYTEKFENVYTRKLIREIYNRIRHGIVEPQSEYFCAVVIHLLIRI
jgi:hypothetical protein